LREINKLTSILKKEPLKREFFDTHYDFEYLLSLGLNLRDIDGYIYLNSSLTEYREDTFVILDLEFDDKDIIEIGAVKLSNGKIIDEFNKLIYKDELDENVSKITGITQEMLNSAKDAKTILMEFKLFLLDSIIVAHNINIDYKILSHNFDKYGFGKLANERLCTQSLANKLLNTEKTSLKFLKDIFNINIPKNHRAYDDAVATMYIFLKYFSMLPKRLKTTKDLIKFINS
jgi:DNA polymerase-3 subunit epsilon